MEMKNKNDAKQKDQTLAALNKEEVQENSTLQNETASALIKKEVQEVKPQNETLSLSEHGATELSRGTSSNQSEKEAEISSKPTEEEYEEEEASDGQDNTFFTPFNFFQNERYEVLETASTTDSLDSKMFRNKNVTKENVFVSLFDQKFKTRNLQEESKVMLQNFKKKWSIEGTEELSPTEKQKAAKFIKDTFGRKKIKKTSENLAGALVAKKDEALLKDKGTINKAENGQTMFELPASLSVQKTISEEKVDEKEIPQAVHSVKLEKEKLVNEEVKTQEKSQVETLTKTSFTEMVKNQAVNLKELPKDKIFSGKINNQNDESTAIIVKASENVQNQDLTAPKKGLLESQEVLKSQDVLISQNQPSTAIVLYSQTTNIKNSDSMYETFAQPQEPKLVEIKPQENESKVIVSKTSPNTDGNQKNEAVKKSPAAKLKKVKPQEKKSAALDLKTSKISSIGVQNSKSASQDYLKSQDGKPPPLVWKISKISEDDENKSMKKQKSIKLVSKRSKVQTKKSLKGLNRPSTSPNENQS